MNVTLRAQRRLDALVRAAADRRCPPIRARDGVAYELDGRKVIGFCSNDYLGLAQLRAATGDVSAGAGASRLISGDDEHHRDTEARLAAMIGAESAVLFPSGFQLNVGVLPCLLEAHDHVSSDRLNHASLIDGMRLSPAAVDVLPHGVAPSARALPVEAAHWWITESIFSMDGDRIDHHAAYLHLARGDALYVDEAHALGLFAGGRGVFDDPTRLPTVLVGTLSKALGCAGAFVAASRSICDFIRNRARSFVFSTGVSPALLPTIDRAIAIVQSPEGDARRAALWTNANAFAQALDLPKPPSPIVPLLVGDNAGALRLAARLFDRGFHVQAIRPPTVPAGTARLRVTLCATHTIEHVQALADALRTEAAALDLPLRLDRGRTDPLP